MFTENCKIAQNIWVRIVIVSQCNTKIAHWPDEFSKDALGEMLLIICNKIVYVYIVNATINMK